MSQGGHRGQNPGHCKIFFFSFLESFVFEHQVLFKADFLCVTSGGARGQNLGHLQSGSAIHIF